MISTDFIVLSVVLVIVGSAVAYIIKAKKNGTKCIGCPSGGCGCSNKNEKSGCCCTCQTKTE